MATRAWWDGIFSSARSVAARAHWLQRSALVLLIVLPACGGGGGGGDTAAASTPLRIVRDTPPNFQVGEPAFWAVTASGGTPPYKFEVLTGHGTPPSGLKILASGAVSGTPLVAGIGPFVVQITDSATPAAIATSQMVFEVGGFEVVADALETPDPWTESSYRIRAPSGSFPVTFQILSSAGGSTLVDPDPALRSATVMTGVNSGNDRIRAIQSNGPWTEKIIRVEQNPVSRRIARFGTTDVWHVRFSGKEDAGHGFTSDFDFSLWKLGLRAPTSTNALGTDADRYAKLYVQMKTLSRLEEHFLNFPDGTPSLSGLKISFPFEEPASPNIAPADGAQEIANPGDYNVIGVQCGVADMNWLGYSFFDSAANDHVESATPAPGLIHKGVFVDGLLSYLSTAFFSPGLTAVPVNAADVPALRALVYSLPSPGGRYDEIKKVADGWANVLSIWLAHEIGHCLSLQHISGIMYIDVNWLLLPGGNPSFSSSDVGIMQAALPGVGR